MREALNSITSQLLLTADVMEKEIEIMNDILAVPPNATDIPAWETTESAETQELVDLPLPSSFVSRYIPVVVDPNTSSCAEFQGLIATITEEEEHKFQRHKVARVFASGAKSYKNFFDEFVTWIEPNFCEIIKKAIWNPSAESSVELLKKMSPRIQSCSTKIAYTISRRSASIKGLDLLKQFNMKNPPFRLFQFLHMIYDYYLQKVQWHISLINRKCFTTFLSIPFRPPMDRTTSQNKTTTSRKQGVFGVHVVSFCSTEELEHGSLHMHVVCWTRFPPNMLQPVANIPDLVESVAKEIDMMIKAEINSEVNVEYLPYKVNKVVKPKPAQLRLTTS
ncbi:hypothetical protein DAPPUDRAFT_336007 [Daphnia pulex]|uniref:Helitron helicase-like domain-containing protein n=1 Tax=Daphnia pulex TaxID=6669 RepID=E9HYY1_DAPPU|nr:hypothetical protein DAPPUDRAFT_336007 [Daphnia pulex]|eukprot:EFX63049.1 hypothetical protein DAPPUDRAFT_336007 [Daphnia pulex]